ncbi:hypothetical protein F4780DRAFT_299737 [Xylariomycetidae sp. FL0641]|nr:hypothetical protein F4780DRAFT_299737 [Xylariomycetidae sp. FL0641]
MGRIYNLFHHTSNSTYFPSRTMPAASNLLHRVKVTALFLWVFFFFFFPCYQPETGSGRSENVVRRVNGGGGWELAATGLAAVRKACFRRPRVDAGGQNGGKQGSPTATNDLCNSTVQRDGNRRPLVGRRAAAYTRGSRMARWTDQWTNGPLDPVDAAAASQRAKPRAACSPRLITRWAVVARRSYTIFSNRLEALAG